MALTVGELTGIISIDDRTVDPALRRVEQAMRQTGVRLGQDADDAGQAAGRNLGGGFVRGADGQWRNMQAQLVDAVTAAALEAESAAHRGGQRVGDGFGDGLTQGARQAGDDAGAAAGDGLTTSGDDGADDAVSSWSDRLGGLKTAALGIGVAAGAVLMDAFGQAMEQNQITAKLGATLGATPAQAQRYGKIAGQLYAGAVTEDFQTAADTISSVMGSGLIKPDATNSQIQSISTKVSDLATTFDQELGGVTNAVSQLMRTGLAKSADEALDIVAKGFSTSANKGDDFLDTLNEYSTQFKRVGLDGKTAVGLIDQAIKGGARDSDQVADALGQFGELTIGQSKTVQSAFQSIGLSSDAVASKLKKGGKSGQEALQMTLDALRGTKDETTKLNAATALFGDPGTVMGDALFAMDPAGAAASSGMDKAAGSAKKLGDSVRNNAATQVEQFKRGAMQKLVDFLGTTVIPALTKFFGFLQDHQTELKTVGIIIAAVVVPALVALGVQSLIAAGRMATAWVAALGPVGWIGLAIGALVVLVITYWDQIKSATLAAWGWIVGKLIWAKDMAVAAFLNFTLVGLIIKHWGAIKSATMTAWNGIVGFVKGIPGFLYNAFLNWTLLGLIIKHWSAIKTATVNKATEMVNWVRGLPGRISRAMGSLGSLLTQKGRNVVQGLWNGIQGMGGWIRSKLMSWAKSAIPGPIAKALGINSPSKVTKAQGRWIARGLIDGLTGSSKQVKAASAKLSDIIADSLSPGKKRSKALGTLGKGTKQLLALASKEEKLAARLKTASKSLADQIKARDALAADVKKGVLDGADITKQDSGGWPQTAESILAGLKSDTAAAQLFAKNLATLRQKGVRSDLIAQIAQAGVAQGSSAAAALANANSGQVKQINSQQAALVKAAGQAGATAGDAMYGAGIRAAQGLVSGLKSQQSAIERQMLAIAKGMSKSIRAALGIKSPSKVMALVGQYTAQGLIKGVEGQRSAVNSTMQSLVDTPGPGSWDMASSRARSAASQKVVLELRSSGRSEDNYLVGRVRRGIRNVSGGDVDLALTGRRSS
ncbi:MULTISPECIES: phage tail tape measure protein [unclassified Streptomyces]|uniref:phage tail tape measure protein n=1 Tax=unclassified Streptomyces TaxID=2593676 RepID=UPI00190B9D9D|nr:MULTISPECIES: phage tail tape measure protein [unclassified Streptomyces]MBK3563230.1 phage tail tape measure protein [Streptomyces sp. MBT62]MBK6013219.1 phage tail tape measure protein [Streptomyces sp. MBT53]